MISLRERAKECVLASSVEAKLSKTFEYYELLQSGDLVIGEDDSVKVEILQAGRPEKPLLVSPDKVPRRGFANRDGQAALLHAIAHIEFNAINLAWDAVCRFANMPEQYYLDWARIAFEEAQHFSMLREHLGSYGYDYGDFEAHDGLWQMAERTKDDVLVRMALVPRVLEARGLDVTPGMIKKFDNIGDDRTVAILNTIYEEEIGHVKIGSHWFKYLCGQRGHDPQSLFEKLINQFFSDGLRGPFNLDARKEAGFSADELTWLKTI